MNVRADSDPVPVPQLSTVSPTGKNVVSSLFVRAPLQMDHVIQSCESVSAETSLLATTKIDIAVGFVGTQGAWDSSMVIYRDVTQAAPAGGSLLDTSKNYTAPSFESALITVVLKGSQSIFGRASASSFYLDIEQLSVMHFLDAVRFNFIVGLIRSNSAYAISLSPSTGRPSMEFTQNVTRLCGPEAQSLSCAIYTNIYSKSVSRPSAVHPLATGIGATSQTGTR